jgi:flagellar motility protein MotE (MotC chaperone)
MKSVSRKEGRSHRTLGVLSVIAVLLISSALMRFSIGAGKALANADSVKFSGQPLEQECSSLPDFDGLLAAFQSREQALLEKEDQMRARLQALAVADREVDAKLARLTVVEEELRNTIALADSAAEDDISRLVSVYEAMKPKDAALLFEEMAPEFAAGFLARMRPEAAAGVLSGLSPEVAYALSVRLAGRNALVARD